jgi:hypothetical protein
MEQTPYLGHQAQLQHIAEELSPRAVARDTPTPILFYISGPTGSGRKTLVSRLWGMISPGEVPRILFTYNPGREEDAVANLASSVKANRSYLEEALAQTASQVEGQSRKLEEAGRPLPPEARLTLWADLIEQNLIENARNNRGLQIIFFLPDFLLQKTDQRQQIARLIPRKTAAVDSRVIVSGTADKVPEELLSLMPERSPVDEVPIPALTIDEVEEWARAKQLPGEFVPEIYQRCGGLPGRLDKAAAAVLADRQERMLVIMAEEALKGIPAELRLNVCLAAMLPQISSDSLKALMSPESADAVMQAISRVAWPESGWKDKAFHAGTQIRQALTKLLERSDPQAYKKALPAAEQFARIHAVIPSGQHRDSLSRLSAFNYFNDAVLKEVLGPRADEMSRFVATNPGYFENTGSNFKLRQEVRQAVEAHMKLAQMRIDDADKARIASAWDARRKQILDAMSASEEKTKREAESLNTLQSQARHLANEIDNENATIARLRRKSMRKAEPSPSGKHPSGGKASQLGSIIMQGAGTLILYVSILMSSRMSILYGAIGIGLIVGGLFVKGGYLAAAPAQEAPKSAQPNEDLDKHERNLHFLNLKRGQLESRQNLVALSIARERSAMKEFDKQLREPYS